MNRVIWCLLTGLCLTAVGGEWRIAAIPAPVAGDVSTLLRQDGTDPQVRWAAFSDHVRLELTASGGSGFVGDVELAATAVPSRNIGSVEVYVRPAGAADFELVDVITAPAGRTETSYRLTSRAIDRSCDVVRLDLKPGSIEMPIVLDRIRIDAAPPTSDGGGIMLGGDPSAGGWLFRDFSHDPDRTVRSFCWEMRTPVSSGLPVALHLLGGARKQELFHFVLTADDFRFDDGNGNSRGLATVTPGTTVRGRIVFDPQHGEMTGNVGSSAFRLPLPPAAEFPDRIMFSVLPGDAVGIVSRVEIDTGAGAEVFDFSAVPDAAPWQRTGVTAWARPDSGPAEVDRSSPESEWIAWPVGQRVFYFDPADGTVRRVTASDGRILCSGWYSSWALQRPDAPDVMLGEKDWTVGKTTRTENELVVQMQLRQFPDIRMEKRYFVRDGVMYKRETFAPSAEAHAAWFITPAERIVIPPERRGDTVLIGNEPWYGVRVPLATVRFPTAQRYHSSGLTRALMVFSPGRPDDSFALVRYEVNRRFVLPISSSYDTEPYNIPVYHPDGALIPMAILPLGTQRESSFEAVWLNFSGDERAYADCWRALPEVEDFYAGIVRPPWLDEVRCQLWLRSDVNFDPVEYTRELLSVIDRGDIMVVLNQPFLWGEFGETSEFRNVWGADLVPDDYRRLIAALKALSPRVKVGLYTWGWTAAPESAAFREHPGFFMTKDKSGQRFNAYPPARLSHFRRIDSAEGFDYFAGQYAGMIESYDVDFVYMDGGSGGIGVIDWERGEVPQDYHWMDFYAFMRKKIQSKRGNSGGMSLNAIANPLSDVGIAEMALDAFHRNPVLVIQRVWAAKVQNRYDPHLRTMLCYWSQSDPWFSDVLIGLGMLPMIECAGLSYYEPDFIARKFPLIGCAWEMSRTQLAGIPPGTALADGDSTVIALTQERGRQKLLALILDRDAPAAVPAVFAPEWEGRAYSAWRNDLKDPDQLTANIPEADQIAAYRDSQWQLQHTFRRSYLGTIASGAMQELRPRLLTILAFADADMRITAVDDLPVQIALATLPNLELEKIDDVTYRVRADGVDIPAYVDIAIGIPADRRYCGCEGGEFRGISIGDGARRAHFRVRPNAVLKIEWREITPSQPVVPGSASLQVRPGESLRLQLPRDIAADLSWNLTQDGDPVMVCRAVPGENALVIPEAARNGVYRLLLTDSGNDPVRWSGDLTVVGELPLKLPHTVPPPEGRPGTLVSLAKPSGGIVAFGTGGGNLEGYGTDPLRLTARVRERPDTIWNLSWAAVELSGIQTVSLRLTSDISTRYQVDNGRSFPGGFAGLLIDYRVAGQWVKRVAIDCGMAPFSGSVPEIGANREPDVQQKSVEWIQTAPTHRMKLNFAAWAPPGWDGEVIVFALVRNVMHGRSLNVDLEDLSTQPAPAGTPGIFDEEAGISRREAPAPLSRLEIPKVDFDALDWRNAPWDALVSRMADGGALTELGNRYLAEPETRVITGWNNDGWFVFFRCAEFPDAVPLQLRGGKQGNPQSDDSVEVYWSDPGVGQNAGMIVNAAGDRLAAGREFDPGLVEVVSRRDSGSADWEIRLRIPLALIGIAPEAPFLVNFCRNRPTRPEENVRWNNACTARISTGRYLTPDQMIKAVFENK